MFKDKYNFLELLGWRCNSLYEKKLFLTPEWFKAMEWIF